MDPRRQQVMRLLVEVFIATNRPVASRDLAEPLGVSSATVRMDLAALEEMGLLRQPHTSAGRVPTREAYRAYAHRFIPPQPLPEHAQEHLEGTLSRVSGEHRLRMAAQLAANLSGYAAVAVAVSLESLLESVFLSLLPDGRVLAVLVLSGGVARELVFDAGFRPERGTLERLENELRGKAIPLREVPARLRTLEQSSSPGLARLARALQERWGEAAPKVVFSSGASPVLNQPESTNVDFLRQVLEILERPSVNGESAPGNPGSLQLAVDDPSGVSKIAAGFRSSVGRGSVMIVGPTRMRYPQAIAVAKAVSDALGAA